MGIQEVTYYTAVCDYCGADIFEDSDWSAWSDASDARHHAKEDHWAIFDDAHHHVICAACVHSYQSKLDGQEWDDMLNQTPEAMEKLRAHLRAVRGQRRAEAA